MKELERLTLEIQALMAQLHELLDRYESLLEIEKRKHGAKDEL